MTQQATEREMAVRGLDRDSVMVRRLRAAIDRLDHGSYGKCAGCEEEISPKRLKALPWAELCIDCQESADRQPVDSKCSRPVQFKDGCLNDFNSFVDHWSHLCVVACSSGSCELYRAWSKGLCRQ